jgi:hypothetical protein
MTNETPFTYENFDWHTFIRGIQVFSDRVDWDKLTNDHWEKVNMLDFAKGYVDIKDDEYITLSNRIRDIERMEDYDRHQTYNQFVKYKALIQTLPKKALQQTPPKKALLKTLTKKALPKTPPKK